MPQADGYVRIVTQNDTTEAQRSTEQLGDTIRDSLDTTPADRMSGALSGVQRGIDDTGSSAVTTGQLIKANLISETVMKGVQQLGAALKETAVQAVNMAMGNETAFAKASTLLKGNDIQEYYEGLIDISNRTGVAFENLAESMYSALSAGVPQDNVLDFVEKSVKLSKGGFTQTETAIDIVTTALNAYQMEMTEAEHVQDVLITTQNLGKTTVDELAGNMGKLIPTANGVNIAFDQLGAMYATVTANGVATAETTTYLNAMINELGASGSTAEKAMMAATKGTDMAEKKFSEISAMGYDVTDVLALMNDYAQSTGQSLSDMFSSSEGAKAASILLSNMQGFKDNITAMEQSAGAAQTAADTMMDTTAEKVQVAKNQIDNLVSTIAQSLLPVIGEAAEEISDTLDSSDIKETAANVGSFISGTLTLLLKNLKLILSAVTGITAAVIAFKTANKLISVIQSWQTAALQVKLFAASEGSAALQIAATTGQLTLQEVVYGVLSGKISIATARTAAFNAVLSMNPAGAIAAVIGILATAITGFSLSAQNAAGETSELAEKANKLSDSIQNMNHSIDDSISKNESEMSMLKSKADRYDELRRAVNLTADEEAELKGLALDLQNVLGDNVSAINSLTGEYNDLTTAVDNYIKKQSAMVKLSAYENAAKEAYMVVDESQQIVDELEAQYGKEYLEAYLDYLNGMSDARDKMESAYGAYNDFRKLFGSGSDWSEDSSNEMVTAARTWEKALNDIKEAQSTIDTYDELLKESFVNGYNSDGSSGSAGKSAASPDNSAANYLPDYWKGKSEDFKYWKSAYKFDYDMGKIEPDDYFAKLVELRDEYLESDSDEWRSVTLEIKKYYDNISEEQQKAYDKQLAEQKKAAEEAEAARKQAYSDEKSQLEFRLRTGKISEKKYYDELAKIRDKYLDKNSAEWRNAYLEIYEYNQRILQENKDTLNQLLSDASDSTLSALQNITAARDSLTAKLTDFNKTFEKITKTVPESIAVKGDFTITTAEHEVETYKMGADSIEDNIRVLEQYGDMLDALKSRGADESTLNDILAMDVEEGMEFGAKLLKMSDREWNGYFDSMAKLRQTAADISAKYYQSEVESLKENFVDKLRKELDGLSTDMYKIGADVAKEFVSGWNEALGTKDLTLGELMKAVSGGTLDTAPRAAQAMVAEKTIIVSSNSPPKTENAEFNLFFGTQPIGSLMVDLLNHEIVKTGKNPLLT